MRRVPGDDVTIVEPRDSSRVPTWVCLTRLRLSAVHVLLPDYRQRRSNQRQPVRGLQIDDLAAGHHRLGLGDREGLRLDVLVLVGLPPVESGRAAAARRLERKSAPRRRSPAPETARAAARCGRARGRSPPRTPARPRRRPSRPGRGSRPAAPTAPGRMLARYCRIRITCSSSCIGHEHDRRRMAHDLHLVLAAVRKPHAIDFHGEHAAFVDDRHR